MADNSSSTQTTTVEEEIEMATVALKMKNYFQKNRWER